MINFLAYKLLTKPNKIYKWKQYVNKESRGISSPTSSWSSSSVTKDRAIGPR